MATPRKRATSEDGATKAPTNKTAAKKAPTKKAATKKAPARATDKRSAATKAPAKRAPSQQSSREQTSEERPTKKVPAMKVARTAAQQLVELTGRSPECVVGVQRTDDGWQVDLEVVESRRIPDSTDILAIYRVETDEDGDLTGYQRIRRYVRGKGGEDR